MLPSEAPSLTETDKSEIVRLRERVAALEERTAPKPVKRVDRIKEWGGIATLFVAVIYSFPLGVWDRFIESAETKRKVEIQNVRTALDQSAIILGEYARIVGPQNPEFAADIARRSLNTRLYLLMTRNENLIDERKSELSTSELIVLSYNFQTMARLDRSIEYAKLAVDRAGSDSMLLAEARRHLAASLLVPSQHRNVAEARATFRAAIDSLDLETSPHFVGLRITLLGQWAQFELNDRQGDKQCGIALRQRAFEEVRANEHVLNDDRATWALLRRIFGDVSMSQSTQEEGNC